MLYLHVPFCKQACSYCNFHFSTQLKNRGSVLAAMRRELTVRRGELPAGPVPSIYFGGGTPSLLTEAELDQFFTVLRGLYYWDGTAETEITLEANPDDLTAATLAALSASPVNRLSIGIQSFSEADLRFMNRAHNATEAATAVAKARAAGFTDLSVDLIYGGQTTSDADWERNLRITTDLGVNHVSAYALTVEPRTALGHRVATGVVPAPDDDKFARQFDRLIDHLTAAGYEHYEISNFCRPGHRSRHNSGYWTGQPYLGVGPGAHSFDGDRTRRWNVSNNATYARAWAEVDDHAGFLAAGPLLSGAETLTERDRYNEFVMTGLRRREGISFSELTERFGTSAVGHFRESVVGSRRAGHVEVTDGGTRLRLTRSGLPLADGIAANAFL